MVLSWEQGDMIFNGLSICFHGCQTIPRSASFHVHFDFVFHVILHCTRISIPKLYALNCVGKRSALLCTGRRYCTSDSEAGRHSLKELLYSKKLEVLGDYVEIHRDTYVFRLCSISRGFKGYFPQERPSLDPRATWKT